VLKAPVSADGLHSDERRRGLGFESRLQPLDGRAVFDCCGSFWVGPGILRSATAVDSYVGSVDVTKPSDCRCITAVRRMSDLVAGDDPQAPQDLRFNYAWNWFSLHAQQRLTGFNFFVVALGAVTVAYADAATHRETTLGIGISAIAVLVSLALFGVDVRNAQIVEIARDELVNIETQLDLNITRKAEAERRWYKSHRWMLRVMLMMAAALSVVALVWAAMGFRW
jgi:hypothetical protein